ncbi:hypothetical protein BDV25DRAFT_144752 [Aspergillus avenaceus]|uniref:Thioredoxin reductase n=1 Tax=Aspergillus avenaceus TaxID=36643 RepID=A0A5N6TGV5_ASPAV|nr:hypothetical protein BDV25DRAFT_144752 [Aspergillus avenaceus]
MAMSSRRPTNGDSMPSPPIPTNDALHPPRHKRHQSQGMVREPVDHDNETTGTYGTIAVPRTRSVSYKSDPAAARGHQASRSFSARTKDLSHNGHPDWMDKPLPLEPYELSDAHGSPRGSRTGSRPSVSGSMKQEDAHAAPSPPNNQPPPLTRSNTTRSTAEQRRDWAADRSPLQKLEVTLNAKSKEEKRARVLQAEMRLKEQMARQRRESDSHTAFSVQSQQDSTVSVQESSRPVSEVSELTDTDQPSLSRPRPGQAPPGRTRSVHAPPPVQHASPLSINIPQHAGNPSNIGAPRTGNVPRRSVSVSYQAGNNHAGSHLMNTSIAQDNGASPTARKQPPPSSGLPRMAVPQQADIQPTGQPLFQRPAISQGREAVKRKDVPTINLVPQQAELGVYPAGGESTPDAASTNIGSNREIGGNATMTSQSLDSEPTSQPKPKRQTVSFNVPPPTPPPLFDWKTAAVARLGASDFDFQNFDLDRSKAWWEGGGNKSRRKSRSLPINYQKPPGQKPSSNKRFQPHLFLKCGPLLRYGGMKRVRIDGPNGSFDKETWRGSVLIVTKDSLSSYEPSPTLRVFSQPMDLLPPPPPEVNGEDAKLAPEYIDPAAGLVKLGRDGRPLYVKPVDHTEEELDLSSIENDDGIYEMSPSLIDYSSDGVQQPIPANRVHSMDGETAGFYKEIVGARLYADPGRDITFWKFNLEIELGQKEQRVAYRLNQAPALGFWVPARGQSMNIMYHTCNGFTPGVDSDKFCGPDPLWRDVLNEHQTRPFHVMVGGGDQIFNDKVTAESTYFQEWVRIKDVHDKYDAAFSLEFKAEIENSFLEHYSHWFSQGLFSLANSQIPTVNLWNDHEIIEGFGSYADEFMGTPVISGLGNLAFKYYLLFQHHSVPEESEADEPSWLLGAQPGPYINQRSRNLFMSLGGGVTLLGLDCRTERMSDEILSEQTCDLIWDRCHREIVRGETKHLLVLLSIPLAYPRVAVVKNILNSRKSLGKAGLFGGFVNKSGSKIEIFDDHWTAKHHKSERTYLIEDLQDLAADKSVRVTILSGDVHLAAVGEFYSNPRLNLPKDRDYRYMPNIIASSIADMPETEMVSDTLNRRNRVHHLDTNTDEDMISIFTHDVNNKPRNNKRLLPRRNWCSIREYQPGSTPPESPETESAAQFQTEEPRPGKLQRTLSLTRGDRPQGGGGLLRRLSLRGRPPTKDLNLEGPMERRMSMDGAFPPAETGEGDLPQPSDFRPGPFLRRPTNLSQKATKRAAKQGDDGVGAYVNLEGGLAITLNMELNPKDPAGITAPYKLLVPMLRYDGNEYDPPAAPIPKGWKRWLSVRKNKREKHQVEDTEAEEGFSDGDDDGEDMGGPEQEYVPGRDAPPESLVPIANPDAPEYTNIIGSGPAAHTAAIYLSRAELQPVLYEGMLANGTAAGGQLTTTTDIENFPGFSDGIGGTELMESMRKQSIRFGTTVITETISKVDFSQRPFKLWTEWNDGPDNEPAHTADAIIIATGANARRLNLPGEETYWQNGISACAVCDGAVPIFRNKPLYVIGGGDSAAEEAMFLAKYGSSVTVLVRRDKLRASKAMANRLLAHPKVNVRFNSVAVEVLGENKPMGLMTHLKVKNTVTGDVETVDANGLFYAVGHDPANALVKGAVDLDEDGYIITKPGTSYTSLEGVFACGDVQDKRYRQAITSAGSGCVAALEAEKFISESESPEEEAPVSTTEKAAVQPATQEVDGEVKNDPQGAAAEYKSNPLL